MSETLRKLSILLMCKQVEEIGVLLKSCHSHGSQWWWCVKDGTLNLSSLSLSSGAPQEYWTLPPLYTLNSPCRTFQPPQTHTQITTLNSHFYMWVSAGFWQVEAVRVLDGVGDCLRLDTHNTHARPLLSQTRGLIWHLWVGGFEGGRGGLR